MQAFQESLAAMVLEKDAALNERPRPVLTLSQTAEFTWRTPLRPSWVDVHRRGGGPTLNSFRTGEVAVR